MKLYIIVLIFLYFSLNNANLSQANNQKCIEDVKNIYNLIINLNQNNQTSLLNNTMSDLIYFAKMADNDCNFTEIVTKVQMFPENTS